MHFTFLAKQGQHNQVASLLTKHVSKPRLVKTDKGVLITCEIPEGMTKRAINKLLHDNKIKGAYSGRNLKVIKNPDPWMVRERVGYNTKFVGVINGKMKKYILTAIRPNCACCGPYDVLEEV